MKTEVYLGLGDSPATKGKQAGANQGGRHDYRDVVDVTQDSESNRLEEQELVAWIFRGIEITAPKHLRINVTPQREGLSKSDVDSSQLEIQELRGAQELAEGFLFLLGAKELFNIRLCFQNSVIANGDWAQDDVLHAPAQNLFHDDFDHSKLWVQQLSCTDNKTRKG